MTPSKMFQLAKQTYNEWSADGGSTLGAALAYYSIFSLTPLLVIAAGVASLVYKEEAARGQIVHEVEKNIGHPAAQALQDMVMHANETGGSWLATLIGIGTMLIGASGAFVQLQNSLNIIWKVAPKPGRTIWNMVRERYLSFVVVALTAALLFLSLVVNAVLVALQEWLSGVLPPASVTLWQGVYALISFAVITLLFALLYKLLPDVIVAWRDVWVGALVTALLFTLGKYVISLYLGRSSLGSAFGAAGSLVAILVWVYYSAQIVLFGAEFTRIYAECCGTHVRPASHAQFTNGTAPCQQKEPTPATDRATAGAAP
jgi:membrane protein